MRTVVIIPNWNGSAFIGACLKSLQKQSQKVDIVVVDNGSADGSVNFIERTFPKAKLIKLPKNYGFAGGVNAGIKYALSKNYKYIGLLNNDAVAQPDWAKNLVGVLKKNPRLGIATSKILDSSGKKIDSTGDMYSVWGTPFPRGRGEVDTGQYDRADRRPVLAASGGASMYRASLFKKIGFFDTSFFAYYEDVDISLRAQLAGFSVRYVPRAVVHHKIGATAKKLGNFQQYHMLKNYSYLYFKNMPGKLFWKNLLRVKVGFWGRIIVLLSRGKFNIVAKALAIITLNFPALLWKRIKIQRARKISTEKFDSLLWHKPSPEQAKKIPFRWFA